MVDKIIGTIYDTFIYTPKQFIRKATGVEEADKKKAEEMGRKRLYKNLRDGKYYYWSEYDILMNMFHNKLVSIYYWDEMVEITEPTELEKLLYAK